MNAVIPQDLLTAVAKITGTNDTTAFQNTIISTIFPNKGANANINEVTAFLMVAKEYGLNPITREIYAFPNRGGIQPIVSIDGWLKIINSHSQFDGLETSEHFDDDGNLISTTCKIHRKDRQNPTIVTEYLEECTMKTEPWKKYPTRMLRHKATIQAARYAFGFSGIVDEDEAQRIEPRENDIVVQEIDKVDSEKIEEIRVLLKDAGRTEKGLCEKILCIKKIEDMTAEQYSQSKSKLEGIISKNQEAVEGEFVETPQSEEIEI